MVSKEELSAIFKIFFAQQGDAFVDVSDEFGKSFACGIHVLVGDFEHLCHFEIFVFSMGSLELFFQFFDASIVFVYFCLELFVFLFCFFVFKDELAQTCGEEGQCRFVCIHRI